MRTTARNVNVMIMLTNVSTTQQLTHSQIHMKMEVVEYA